MAFFAAIFTTVVMGGFFFMINWLAGDRGKVWSHKHSQVLLTAYGIAMSASIILKLIDSPMLPVLMLKNKNLKLSIWACRTASAVCHDLFPT